MTSNELTPNQQRTVQEEVKRRLKKLTDEPFIVAIMGQTGVGKSSLINALFNVNLKTDAIRPCTKEIEVIKIFNEKKHALSFIDLPGIGESDDADAKYLAMYKQYLQQADIILWAFHSDNRSIAFDRQNLFHLLKAFSPEEQRFIVNKITFVLTKADVISPVPWIVLYEGKTTVFAPDKEIDHIFHEKTLYYEEQFISPFASMLVSETYNDAKCTINDGKIQSDEHYVRYRGLMRDNELAQYSTKYPKYAEVFKRLRANHQVVVCSSSFRYGLYNLLNVVVNKLGEEAVLRFKNFLSDELLNRVPTDSALKKCNMTIVKKGEGVIFDLARDRFPRKKL